MKRFRMIRGILCLAAALLAAVPAGGAEGAFEIADEGLELTETVSIYYPVVTGGGDEALRTQINDLIRERCRVGDYLSRAARLLSGGSLRADWRGGAEGDVLSVAVSAEGAVETARNTHVWTAVTVDLRDGREIPLTDLFSDGEAAREKIKAYLEEAVAPELSAHLQNSELTPLPELFLLERTGLTLLYPVEQLSTLSDRAGDIRIGWNVLEDVLDLGEGSIADRIGVRDMISLTESGAERLRAAAETGGLTDVPAWIGDSMKELTDRYHLLTDWDGIEEGRLFALEGGCFRGIFLVTDDLSPDWRDSVVRGIRMDQGCLWGLCPGETPRAEWLDVLGEPDGSAEVGAEKAEANRLVPGTCDYYRCGDYLLQLYSDGDGTLVSVMLTE